MQQGPPSPPWGQPPPAPGWAPSPPPAWGPPPPAGWGPPPPPGWAPPPPWAPPSPYWGWNPGTPPPPVGVGRFRAQSIPELLDAAFSLYRRNFVLLVAIAALVQVPFALVSLALTLGTDVNGRLQRTQDTLRASNADNPLTQSQHDAIVSDLGVFAISTVAVLLITLLIVIPLSEAATVRAVSDRYLDRASSVGTSFGVALRRIRPLLAAVLLQFALIVGVVAVATMLILVGGSAGIAVAVIVLIAAFVMALILVVRWSLAPQAIVVEGVSGVGGLRRSWQLTTGRYWRTLGFRLLLGLITGIVSALVALVVNLPLAALDTTTHQVLSQVGSTVVSVFIAPLTLIGITLYYYDQRIRREAFDVEMVTRSL